MTVLVASVILGRLSTDRSFAKAIETVGAEIVLRIFFSKGSRPWSIAPLLGFIPFLMSHLTSSLLCSYDTFFFFFFLLLFLFLLLTSESSSADLIKVAAAAARPSIACTDDDESVA